MKAEYTITQKEVGISARHPISAWRLLERNKTVHPHDHAYHEIALCVGGSGWHLTGESREKISRGSLLVSAPGQVHSIEIPEWLDLVNLFYLAEWVFHDFQDYWEHPQICMLFGESLLRSKGLEAEPVKQGKLASSTVRAAQKECDDLVSATKEKDASHLYLRATFEKILALIGADVEAQEQKKNQSKKKVQGKKKVQPEGRRSDVWKSMGRIESIIQSGDHFSVEALAKDSPVQAAHLTRLFVQETGKTLMEFYQQRRVQIACVRLLNPLHSITEIGMDLNFTDTAHFSRLFHRYYRMSPRDFRIRHGIGPRES